MTIPAKVKDTYILRKNREQQYFQLQFLEIANDDIREASRNINKSVLRM